MEWKHEALAEDLATIKGTGYLDVCLGSKWIDSGVQRADVIEIKPSYTRFCLTIYEVKVSRSDFLSDIRSDKWMGYLEHCHRFYFAVPKGMVKKEEVPYPAGLIVRGETGWNTVKAPQIIDSEIPIPTILSMLFNKQKQDSSIRHRDKVCYVARHQNYIDRDERTKILKSLGKKVAAALNMQEEYERKKDNYEWLQEHIYRQISEALGANVDKSLWRLHDIVSKIKEKAQK